ncbi:type VI secretion system baseplate subunit TssE [Bradyrhizobium sp. CCGUVB23]|uniref:type VI secretion system baseplate subunit TssE n=1 Tax=Bradyrhizobium sp. CCGUVB23 TaxID=2949630 RepID=UPI0020B3D52F|nr:type VI secretion system baseplate subunit TssE [Bradyrhizobium sp. CCGUVB23]MCP3460881.1 type VI secretion system baseplate subunit TssE [Bradyrhizobium sp. CCGUVB23]
MFDRSLIERLEEAAVTMVPSHHLSFDRLQASILENLRRILNSRQGCCETRPDYGLPDLNDAIGQGVDAVRAVARMLKQEIEAFEPRLRNVSIRFHADPDKPLQLTFHVTAMVNDNDQVEHVSFDTILSDDRHVLLRG